MTQAVLDREYAAGTVKCTVRQTQGGTGEQGVLVGGDTELHIHSGEQSKDDSQDW